MGNVTLPTPVFVAGGALCLLAGYLAGSVLGSDAAEQSTATVASYQPRSSQLCLSGDAVKGEKELNDDGQLCGTWSHPAGSLRPHKGDHFRYITLDQQVTRSGTRKGVVILGTVVD